MNKKSGPSNQELNSYIIQEDTELLKASYLSLSQQEKALLKSVMGGGQLGLMANVITQFNYALKKRG